MFEDRVKTNCSGSLRAKSKLWATLKTPAWNEPEMLGDFLGGFGGGDYWVDFEVD
jgi:hypothetical protein